MTLHIYPQAEILSASQERVLKVIYKATPEPMPGGGFRCKLKLRSDARQVINEIRNILNDTGSPVKINRSCT